MPEKIDYTPHDKLVVNAFLCMDAIEERDTGILSAIKIIDNINYPKGNPSARIEIHAVVLIKALDNERERHLQLYIEGPSGKRSNLGEGQKIDLGSRTGGSPFGNQTVIALNLQAGIPGHHWLEFWIDGRYGTKTLLSFTELTDTSQAVQGR